MNRWSAVRAGLVLLAVSVCTFTVAQTPDDSKVTVNVDNRPISEVLQTLAEASGNAPLSAPEDLRDTRVTLRVKEVTYWRALDRLCELSGLIYIPDLKRGGVRIDKALERDEYGAYAGPVVVKVEEVRRIGDYRAIRKPRGSMASVDTRCVVRYFWEDRLPVVRALAEVVEVTGSDGRPIIKTQIPQAKPYRVHFEHGRRPPSGTMTFYMTRIPKEVDRLSEISGVISLWLGEEQEKLVFDDVLGEGKRTASSDELTLTLKDVKRQEGAVRIAVEADLARPETKILFGTYGPPFGFYLVGPNGKRTACTVESVTRNLALPKQGGYWLDGRWQRKARGKVSLLLTCETPGAARGSWSLVYVFAETIRKAEFPFVIKDVPLR